MRVVALPPPNVTGRLHLGHALTAAVSEAWLRRAAMAPGPSDAPVWVPGFDHAGIATQLQVSAHLRAQGLDPASLPRPDLLRHALRWKEARVREISDQLRELRLPLAWDRSFYTMDPAFSAAVRHAFVRLHRSGRISRSLRPVHWSPHLQSTLSNREVEAVEVAEPRRIQLPSGEEVEAGWIYTVRYPIAGGPSSSGQTSVSVATTRPETIPADVAVAVHPDDQRYASLLASGARLCHPLFSDRLIPLVPEESVKPEVGTGALKITPAHSDVDWEIGDRHGLARSANSCLDWDGSLSWGEARGKGRARGVGRAAVVEELERRGLLEGRAAFPTTVPVCRRSGDVVETMVRPQWAMDIKGLVSEEDVDSLRLQPASSVDVLRSWLLDGEDWLLSRQLWWGHQVPAWHLPQLDGQSEGSWVVGEESPSPEAVQDPDVLDTWFSSALVPLVVGGWPQNTSPKPLELLVSGHDILGFWIARMMLMSKALTGRLPFPSVLLHSLVTDGRAVKMSKSSGNVVDPIQLIRDPPSQRRAKGKSLEARGADWLKFSLLSKDASARFLSFSVPAAEEHLNLIFKLRNSLLFWRVSAWSKAPPRAEASEVTALDERFDAWLRCRLAKTLRAANEAFDDNRFHEAASVLSRFYWEDLCDTYLEAVKPQLRLGRRLASVGASAAEASSALLRSLHPLLPDTTAELWAEYPEVQLGLGADVSTTPVPQPVEPSAEDERTMGAVDSELRLLRAMWGLLTEMGLGKKAHADLLLAPSSELAEGLADGVLESGLGSVRVRRGVEKVWRCWLSEGAVPVQVVEPTEGRAETVLARLGEDVAPLQRLQTQLAKRSKEALQLEERLHNLRQTREKRFLAVQRPSQMKQVEKLDVQIEKTQASLSTHQLQVKQIQDTLDLARDLSQPKTHSCQLSS